jgi:transcriptional regulator with XRE-family HTH domain
MKVVGERLRILRESVRLSQAKIAELSGSAQSSIGRYECNGGGFDHEKQSHYRASYDRDVIIINEAT